jgi:hypothetical protein
MAYFHTKNSNLGKFRWALEFEMQNLGLLLKFLNKLTKWSNERNFAQSGHPVPYRDIEKEVFCFKPLKQGCQMFLATNVPKGGNVPNCH